MYANISFTFPIIFVLSISYKIFFFLASPSGIQCCILGLHKAYKKSKKYIEILAHEFKMLKEIGSAKNFLEKSFDER